MNKYIGLILVSSLFLFVSCENKDNKQDEQQGLALLYLASQGSEDTTTYGNTASGSSTSISGSYGASTAASSSVTTSFASATTTANKLIAPDIDRQIRAQILQQTRQVTCTASSGTISGTVTTSSSISCLSGSATYTPNLTFSGTTETTCPSSGTAKTSTTYNYTGSTTIVYNNCNLKVFDVKTYVDSGQQTIQSTTTTLNGTASVTNITGVSKPVLEVTSSSSSGSITTSSGTFALDASSTSTISSSSFSVDGGSAVSMEITAKYIANALVGTYTNTFDSSTSTFSIAVTEYSSGTNSFQNSGTINGETINGSYTINTADLVKYNTAISSLR
ncbi:MAG: hypothetical protein AAF518_09630 [Spirochaetota bacterium]